MKAPNTVLAETLLNEAEKLNPGAWADHNRTTGICAKTIAAACGMDKDSAYALGLLHDIGRRYGDMDMRHIWSGYTYMMELGYEASARICLTHSFPYKNIAAYNGENDCKADESKFIQDFITKTEYDDYDRLIQLCDALAYPNGPAYIEKRLVDVVIRKGFNDYTLPKWKAFMELKQYFDTKAKTDIYKLLQV